MNIGIFDSGVGGLTVAKPMHDSGFFKEIFYYGDTARVPYGSKDENTVLRYALEAVEFFNGLNIDILIVACNTVSVIALEEMNKYSKVPVFGVVDPGVESLVLSGHASLSDEILIIGTRSTIGSGVYQKKIRGAGFCNITSVATPLLVSLVEEGIYEGPLLDMVLSHYFSGTACCPKVVVLGCTHFPLLSAGISRFFSGAKTVHSGEAVLSWMRNSFELKEFGKSPKVQISASENVDKVKSFARLMGMAG